MQLVTKFLHPWSCLTLVGALSLCALQAQSPPPAGAPKREQAAAPAPAKDPLKVILVEEADPKAEKAEREAVQREIDSLKTAQDSRDSDKRSANAAVLSVKFAKWSFYLNIFAVVISIGALTASILQVKLMYTELSPLLRELKTQSLIASINLVKQRLDSLTAGQWNLSQHALYTEDNETTEQLADRAKRLADQICEDSGHGRQEAKRRAAVQRLIHQ